MQKKYQEALEVLDSPLSGKLAPGMIEAKKAEYLKQMKRWEQMMDYMEQLLLINSDQWNYYVNYTEALFEISSESPSLIDRAKKFLFSLLEKERLKSTNRLRGPYLAMLHFWQQLKERQYDASSVFGIFLHDVMIIRDCYHKI